MVFGNARRGSTVEGGVCTCGAGLVPESIWDRKFTAKTHGKLTVSTLDNLLLPRDLQ